MHVPPVPKNYGAVIAIFGNINNYIQDDGTLANEWERDFITRIDLPAPVKLSFNKALSVRRITVHKKLADVATEVFSSIHREGLWSEFKTYGGGFNFRSVRGKSSKLSLHGWAIAFDINPDENPLGSKNCKIHPGIIQIFSEFGFFHGLGFTRPDPMHFQYALNC